MTGQLLASSPTRENLKRAIAAFYYTTPERITLNDGGAVLVGDKHMQGVRWIAKRGRARFERMEGSS